jgi:toxin-antitoxin system PIN domain toxin
LIAVDTNVLVYAHRRDAEWHDAATETMRSLAEGRASWAIPWPCVHEFIAIVTHPRVYDPPSTAAQAIMQVDAWLASPSVVLLGEVQAHWDLLKTNLVEGRIKGAMVHDARIATICEGHGVTVFLTADRDFSRFPKLAIRNPLLG